MKDKVKMFREKIADVEDKYSNAKDQLATLTIIKKDIKKDNSLSKINKLELARFASKKQLPIINNQI